MSSYKKNAASNRDALFGGAAPSGSGSSSKRAGATAGSSNATTAAATSTGTSTAKGYNASTVKKASAASLLSADARAAKLKEALDYRNKAIECIKSGFFKKPDPVAACTYFKRAADAYQQLGDHDRLERLFRVESGKCNMQCQAWASAASDYARAADVILNEESDNSDSGAAGADASGTTSTTLSMDDRRREAASYHKVAASAWTQMNEPAKAAASLVAAAMALHFGVESAYLSKEALVGMEEAVEAHVPDPLNPYSRYRQTGTSAFLDANSEETAEHCSPATKELAQAHLVTRAYAHEPLQQLVHLLTGYGEYQSALYAAGAVSVILQTDGLSTLSLSRAYVVETILTLALGDPVMAEQQFLNRHCQDTFYLKSRECQLAEELFRAVKMRDMEALEAARSITGPNRAALANLMHDSLRAVVQNLRVSGAARKSGNDTTTVGNSSGTGTSAAAPNDKLPSLQELMQQKTGYEQEGEGGNLDPDALSAELDNLDFGDDDDDDDNDGKDGGVGDDELDALEDDDIDLR